jgi:hypothetical protein
MKRIKRFNLLSLFGDLKPKSYDISLQLAALHFANPLNRSSIWGSERLSKDTYMSVEIEKMFKSLLEDGLIKRVENVRTRNIRLEDSYQVSPRDFDLQLTDKGRDCLSGEQIARAGDYSWYKRYDGSLDSASKINPTLFK